MYARCFLWRQNNGNILRRNCLLKEVIEGKIQGQKEVTRRGGRRRKKLLDDLGDGRGYSHLTELYECVLLKTGIGHFLCVFPCILYINEQ
jgi:hypothetical protein